MAAYASFAYKQTPCDGENALESHYEHKLVQNPNTGDSRENHTQRGISYNLNEIEAGEKSEDRRLVMKSILYIFLSNQYSHLSAYKTRVFLEDALHVCPALKL